MNLGKIVASVALIGLLAVWTSCRATNLNCRKAEEYHALWVEAEQDLDRCVKLCDRVTNP